LGRDVESLYHIPEAKKFTAASAGFQGRFQFFSYYKIQQIKVIAIKLTIDNKILLTDVRVRNII
jgi:hypothetical protein